MNRSTLVGVARFHLVDRFTFAVLPLAVMTFSFLVNLAIFAAHPANPKGAYTGGLAAIYFVLCVLGVQSIVRSLPFGLALGVSRRAFYTGTALLAAALAAGHALVLTALTAVEGVSGGWGVDMHFFRVPYILDGPWYLTWLTSFVVLTMLFVYGMWYGIVFKRWNLTGLVIFAAAQATAVTAAILVITWARAWHGVGRFFTTLTAAGLTGLLAALAAVLLAGGYATVRRVTV